MTSIAGSPAANAASAHGSYEDLTALFSEWRAFERPALRDGAPDYTAATLARKHAQLKTYQARLQAIKPDAWPIPQQVDYHLLRAEMNGLDFDLRVLKPWERDPAFYTSIWTAQSDTPAHEGPTNHAIIELWTYSFPLTPAAEAKLTQELQSVPPLLAQAQLNLVGNARDLWIAGIGNIKQQRADLLALEEKTASNGPALKQAIQAAQQATAKLVTWLEQQAPSKTGPSGIGKENYTWSLRNVHLVPLTWEDEVMLLKRELARAHIAAQAGRAAQPRAAGAAGDLERRGISAPRQCRGHEVHGLHAGAQHPAGARLHGSGDARAHRRIRAGRDAQLLRDREPSRAARAVLALLSLVGPGADARGAAREPAASRPAAVQHLGQPRRGHGDGDGRDDAARRPVRRQSARPRSRLDHAGAARRARARLAVRAGQRVHDEAGRRLPRRVDAARLDAAGPGPARLRAAAVPAPARLRHVVHHRQVSAGAADGRAQPASSAKPSRSRATSPR